MAWKKICYEYFELALSPNGFDRSKVFDCSNKKSWEQFKKQTPAHLTKNCRLVSKKYDKAHKEAFLLHLNTFRSQNNIRLRKKSKPQVFTTPVRRSNKIVDKKLTVEEELKREAERKKAE